MPRRLFVALPPDEAAIEHLQQFLNLVGPPGGTPRQTAASGWHITSVFLGEEDDEVADEFWSVLTEQLLGFEPFELALRGGGSFAPPDVSRTWWAGVHDPDGALPQINEAALLAARRARIKVDAEKYFSHLTVYRGRPRPSPQWTRAWDQYQGPAWQADAVHLMESILQPTGSHYRTIARHHLRAQP